ncbi:MAG: RdgB/HAM1 family non-canonical purine NTP pyrophosphatase [Oscillospiraceae bacterium]
MKMKIILASNNKNKLREFKNILEPLGYEVLTQSEAGADIEADETGTTFEENAYIKAKAAYDITHLPVIADDSGLEVDALGGEPGIYSARYAEEGKRCAKVLSKLEGVPDEKRTARFICAVCYINEKGESFTVKGVCEGKIGYEKRGTNGFGYDPIFMYGDRSFAELSAEEKDSVSHRADALRKFEKRIKGE